MPIGNTPEIDAMINRYNKLPTTQAGGTTVPLGVQAQDPYAEYQRRAALEIDPRIQAEKNALANKLAGTLSGYETQQGSLTNLFNTNSGLINNQYDRQVENQNIQTNKNMNGFSNSVLGRGLGRSTIATSGLGEMQNIGSRLVNNLNQNRGDALNGLTAQYQNSMSGILAAIANANAGYQSDMSLMDAKRLGMISELARSLEDTDWNRNFKTNQFNFDKTVTEAGLTGQYNGQKTLEALMKEAALTGQYNGQATFDAQNTVFNNLLKQGELTGMYNNAPTLDMLKYKLAAGQAGGSGSGGYSGGVQRYDNGTDSGMSGTYSVGSRGDNVKQIQNALGISADGIFGAQTKQAVMDFQKANGLTADGIVGKNTLKLMSLSTPDRVDYFNNIAQMATKAGDAKGAQEAANIAMNLKGGWEADRWEARANPNYPTPVQAYNDGTDSGTNSGGILKSIWDKLTKPVYNLGNYLGR